MDRPRVLPIFVSGCHCPVGCTYCSQAEQTGARGTVSSRTVRDVVEGAIGDSRSRDDRRVELAFYGGTFTALPVAQQRDLLGAGRHAIEAGLIDAIRVSTHPRWTRAEHLQLLLDFGVETVEVGVQTLDDHVLAETHRGVDAAETLASLERVRQAGFTLGVQLMVGLPGADRASDRRTAEGLTEVGATLGRVYPTLVFRGSSLAETWRRGEFTPLSIVEAITRAADQVQVLEGAGVRVQRIGLHQDDHLLRARLAGPVDPAFGERVRSEIAYRRLQAIAATRSGSGPMTVHVPASELSQWLGQRRENVERFTDEFPALELQIRPDDALEHGETRVESA